MFRNNVWRLVLLSSLLCGAPFGALFGSDTPSSFDSDYVKWKDERLKSVLGPSSWLSVIGRPTLVPGIQTVGSGTENTHVLLSGPKNLGTLNLTADNRILFLPRNPEITEIDGIKFTGKDYVELLAGNTGKTTSVKIGSITFSAYTSAEEKGITFRDSGSQHLKDFVGLEYFAQDPKWKIQADWVPFNQPLEYEYDTVFGKVVSTKAPGKAVFKFQGKTYEILPLGAAKSDGTLHFVLKDGTSGLETYGSSRFLYASPPVNGKITLDFNQLVNPPCGFSHFPPCPLPIPQNWLDFSITAGEKTYTGKH